MRSPRCRRAPPTARTTNAGAIKSQCAPAAVAASTEPDIDVNEMLTWRVPVNIPAAQKTSDQPITLREQQDRMYSLVGLRAREAPSRLRLPCAGRESRAANAPQVIVEIPRTFESVQRDLMAVAGMKDGEKSKTFTTATFARK